MSRGIHLGVDAVGIKHSGGAMVLLDVLDAAMAHPGIRRITVLCSPARYRQYTFPQDTDVRVIEVPLVETLTPLRLAWVAGMGLASRLSGCDVLLGLANMGIGFPGVPCAPFIQQALPFSAESLALMPPRVRVQMHLVKAAMGASVRRAPISFVQTPTMRTCVAEAFSVQPSSIEVCIPHSRPLPSARGVPEEMRTVDPSRRLLFVGNPAPYKNLAVCFEALPALRRRFPGLTCFVTWPANAPSLQGRDGVAALGYLESQSLGDAYRAATALVLPSLVESGPLTPAEAMSYGTPVIIADRPYARDMCEDAALFFDPHSANHLVQQVEALFTDPTLRDGLVSRGLALVGKRRAQQPYRRMFDRLCGLVRCSS